MCGGGRETPGRGQREGEQLQVGVEGCPSTVYSGHSATSSLPPSSLSPKAALPHSGTLRPPTPLTRIAAAASMWRLMQRSSVALLGRPFRQPPQCSVGSLG